MPNIELLEKSMPVAPIRIAALGCRELAEEVDRKLVKFRKELVERKQLSVIPQGYSEESFIVECECPRFGTGEGKGYIKESVRGTDLYFLVDVANYSLTYSLCGHENHMSPDNHFQDLKRIISAATGKAHRINVIMPFLYEGRQHRRTKRESLDCALALKELSDMGVSNIITFDAHDPRVQNSIPLNGFDNFFPTYQFLKAVPGNCMVIFVGDKNQLPSVDSGNVLGDLLEVEFIPKVILNEIYRQGKDSTILQRALDMSNDKMPDLSDSKDFTFWEERNVQDLQTGVLDLYFNECKTYGIENVMFLTPMNKYELGVNTLNEIIQDTVNPYVKGRPQIKVGKRFFRLNDRVVQLTNEDDFGVYNGMVGTITDITLEDKDLDVKDSITVDYGNVQCEYTRERFENIKLAYALTIHKSQGSEAQSVIMICHSSHRHMLTKKLIYTGMTRAKKHLHLVGEKSMVKHALTVQEPPRNSRLAYWCRQCV